MWNNQVALVTGASRGIGRSCALHLAKHGVYVIGTSTTQEGADFFTAEFLQNSLPGSGVILNLQDSSTFPSIVESVCKIHGSLTILVNNAGICHDGLAIAMKEIQWNAVIDINLNAAFFLTKIVLRQMLKKNYGRIINISSVSASIGNPGQANYCAAKAGLEGLTRALAREVAKRCVTVNCVAPGLVATDMTASLTLEQREALLAGVPMARMATVDEIAHAVCFLASPEASYITGAVLHVNGGVHC